MDNISNQIENTNDNNDQRSGNNISKYTTIDLIEDLMSEVQNYSEELAILFPERIFTKKHYTDNIYPFDSNYSQRQLSSFWGYNEKYVSNLLSSYRKNKDFKIFDNALSKLKQKVLDSLREKGYICLEMIDEYENSELNIIEFVISLQFELGRISGEIPLIHDEATQIFGFLVSSRLNDIRNNHNNYKFSLWRLNDMIERIELVFHEKAENCYNLIQKYKNLNKDLKEYPHQQHNVGNPHYFKNILPGELDKAYIFGFLGHDGFTSGGYIGLRINPKDDIIIDKLISLIELDKSSLKIREEAILQLYKGELKEYHSLKLAFGCKPMVKELEELGDMGSGSLTKEVPYVIKNLVEVAKQKSLDNWMCTSEGQTALAWLLGTYDADGSYKGGYSGVIYSSHRSYLEEIKDLFEINARVFERKESGPSVVFGKTCITKGEYALSISSRNVFTKMMEIYWHSFDRKRPEKYRLASNNLDNYLGI